MLPVQTYIKTHGLQALTDNLSIKVKEYPAGVVKLNYDQILSPKGDPVCMDCRGLILDSETFSVVAISFQRFFNLGEMPEITKQVDFNRARVLSKEDGSLVMIYWCEKTNRFEISTRGLAFSEGDHPAGDTFRNWILKAINAGTEESFQQMATSALDKQFTYSYEYCGPENRIVRRYDSSIMVLHNVRDNNFPHSEVDSISDLEEIINKQKSHGFNVRLPEMFPLSNESEIVSASNSLGNLHEGFVVWDPVSKTRVKVKSVQYVAVHHLRDNGVISPKRILQLVVNGDQSDYLEHFPEDTPFFTPWIDKIKETVDEMSEVWNNVYGIESQKDFALAVKDYPYSGFLFMARKTNKSVHDVWLDSDTDKKVNLFLK